MSTAIRNISADAERCDACTVSNNPRVKENVLNPEASAIRQARQDKDQSSKNCRRCRHTTFALQYDMTRITPTSGVFEARNSWLSLPECLSSSSTNSLSCNCSSLFSLLCSYSSSSLTVSLDSLEVSITWALASAGVAFSALDSLSLDFSLPVALGLGLKALLVSSMSSSPHSSMREGLGAAL
jgi:hypothetical protein